jgi:hypothetical protein
VPIISKFSGSQGTDRLSALANYLFCRADSGGRRAAAIYSLVGSAKLNGLDPELYLRQVLTSIPSTPSAASTNYSRGKLSSQTPRLQLHQVKRPLKNKWTLQVSLPSPYLYPIDGDHWTLTQIDTRKGDLRRHSRSVDRLPLIWGDCTDSILIAACFCVLRLQHTCCHPISRSVWSSCFLLPKVLRLIAAGTP